MSVTDNAWALYLALNLEFVKNLVIKNPYVADYINRQIEEQYGTGSVDYHSPETWKYYLNLNGQYHFSDSPIRIVSLDTLEMIEFTKANLQVHTNTRLNYKHGSRYYKLLLEKHPGQQTLINGILNPIDLQTAINAEDFDIIYFPDWLIEPQEHSLAFRLQKHCKAITTKWDNYRYDTTNEYFIMAYVSIVQMSLLPALLNIRLSNCGTNEAHTYHITHFLASHGRLDRYIRFMTLEQKLFLYRNIRYIERNIGKTETFQLLIEKLLTARQIPLSEFSIRQLITFDDKALPLIQVRRKALNTLYNVPDKDYFDFLEIPAKEANTAPYNTLYYEARYDAVEESFKLGGSSVVQTKDLESNMVDLSGAWPDPIEVVLLREWIYHAFSGRYQATVTYRDPISFQMHSLSVQDAFIYLQYLVMTLSQTKFDHVPGFTSIKYRRPVKPGIPEIISVAPKRFLFDREALAAELISSHPTTPPRFASTFSFHEYATKVYLQCRYDWYITSSFHEMNTRGEVEQMTRMFYATEQMVNPYEGELMTTWLTQRNLPVYDYTPEQAAVLILDVFKAGSGHSYDEALSLKNIQEAMIAIMRQLTSYTIQFITNVNKLDIIPLNWSALRFATPLATVELNQLGPIGLNIVDEQGQLTTDVHFETDPKSSNIVLDYETKAVYVQKEMVDMSVHKDVHVYRPLHVDALAVSSDHNPLAIFNSLTKAQQLSIKIPD